LKRQLSILDDRDPNEDEVGGAKADVKLLVSGMREGEEVGEGGGGGGLDGYSEDELEREIARRKRQREVRGGGGEGRKGGA